MSTSRSSPQTRTSIVSISATFASNTSKTNRACERTKYSCTNRKPTPVGPAAKRSNVPRSFQRTKRSTLLSATTRAKRAVELSERPPTFADTSECTRSVISSAQRAELDSTSRLICDRTLKRTTQMPTSIPAASVRSSSRRNQTGRCT
uniref:(northern house mosquito) hypothetical protein n=1 Tax=Culex pipiens TaxID=7175 RepID=A0A8D8ERW3_CULPI